MRDLNNAEKDQIEALIDACGLCDVLGAISEICQEKADHIRLCYDDEPLVSQWRDMGNSVGRISTTAATRKL